MAQTGKVRKKRDTSLKRMAILEGAISVFTKNGFDASSMDHIAEVAHVSKRTIYNHFPSKEILFQEIVADFLKQRDEIKPIRYVSAVSLEEQLKEFARAELFLINDPVRRGLSKLFTSVFLMDIDFGKKTRSQYEPHRAFIIWLNSAREDRKLNFQSPELAARVFYGMVEGCLTYPALFSDGESLKYTEPLLNELISAFLARYQYAGNTIHTEQEE
ncbi:MAG: TetR/AcrR family transcriptional regulator [Clostridiales bacterium]|nr:TetR/AcrR family transcriptional regulator [Clostridiales bacterium]